MRKSPKRGGYNFATGHAQPRGLKERRVSPRWMVYLVCVRCGNPLWQLSANMHLECIIAGINLPPPSPLHENGFLIRYVRGGGHPVCCEIQQSQKPGFPLARERRRFSHLQYILQEEKVKRGGCIRSGSFIELQEGKEGTAAGNERHHYS
jgi:hypothetical protein